MLPYVERREGVWDRKLSKVILIMSCKKHLQSLRKSLGLASATFLWELCFFLFASFFCGKKKKKSEIVRLSFLNSTSCILFWSVWFKRSNLFSCTVEVLVLIYHLSIEKWLMTSGSALQAVFINGSEKQRCMYLRKKIK